MPGKIDIGGYFKKLTKRGSGGRRHDTADDTEPSSDAGDDSSGGISGALKDAIGKSKSGAKRAADKVSSTARRRKQPELASESVVSIEYSPRRDGDPDPGEVVWGWVPFEEDPSQGKDRPVVIIGRRGAMLVGVPLTTKRNHREAQLNMGTGGWDPKRRTSYARIWRMCDIDPDRCRREGAVLDVQRFESLVRAVDEYYDVRLPDTGSVDDY
ncbi:PemK-like, MazF-like toxin of type II toxin-antitoxin system [Ilumatobacter fluminis]|uniref:PemK-like, MazF-like toxin of type II toxin-antitoxin system n=1 Tax=Ilumatobacter fluminis TaxID=467091 RepID=A0A4R7HWV2_9ACTN|nr:type II toxin-antitoxin system PemK/MazF family toxin [Ilumatobacter fluminis]TDT15465.1 PemK-like, MazF-like toxin of type II toxin-antitoxin system [Ilumatobacter fluminis]